MTVEVATSRISYAGDGVSASFPIPFYFLADADVAVWKRAAFDSETEAPPAEDRLVLATDYAVLGAGDLQGGSVALAQELDVGERLTIVRDAVPDQQTEFPENGPFPASAVENAIDRRAMFDQQMAEQLNRTISVPVTVDDGFSAKLPDPKGNAGLMLGFSSDGSGIEAFPYPTSSGSAGSLTNLPLSNTFADLAFAWINGSAMGMIDNEFRYFIAGDTHDSLRVGRGDVRIRSEDGAAGLRLRRTELNADGNNLASILASGNIAVGDAEDERLFGRLRFYIEDDDASDMQGGFQLLLTDGYEAKELETIVLEATPNLVTFNTKAAYAPGITPTDSKDLADLEAIDTKLSAGVGMPYPIPVSFTGSISDGVYVLIRNVPAGFRIDGAVVQCGAGTADIDIRRDGGVLSSPLWSIGASTSAVSVDAVQNGTNEFNEGRELSIEIRNASGLTDLNVDIKAVLI